MVELEGTGETKLDRKGIRYADIKMPTGSIMNLTCYKCGHLIENLEYYTRAAPAKNEANLQKERIEGAATPCAECGEKTQFTVDGVKAVDLHKYNDKYFCKKCLITKTKENSPDPSNKYEKYEFNKKSLKWEISKIRQTCTSCSKPRWLNYENRWKTVCLPCYKKQV